MPGYKTEAQDNTRFYTSGAPHWIVKTLQGRWNSDNDNDNDWDVTCRAELLTATLRRTEVSDLFVYRFVRCLTMTHHRQPLRGSCVKGRVNEKRRPRQVNPPAFTHQGRTSFTIQPNTPSLHSIRKLTSNISSSKKNTPMYWQQK